MTDLGSEHGTWLNDRKVRAKQPAQVMPGDTLQFGSPGSLQLTFKVKMCHNSVFEQLAAMPASEAKVPQPA